jgi:hypothetical protein
MLPGFLQNHFSFQCRDYIPHGQGLIHYSGAQVGFLFNTFSPRLPLVKLHCLDYKPSNSALSVTLYILDCLHTLKERRMRVV